MTSALGTIFQAYVNAVTSRRSNGEPQDVGISVSQLEPPSSSSSSSLLDINHDPVSRQPTLLQSFSNRSFFRRAWDKVESKF